MKDNILVTGGVVGIKTEMALLSLVVQMTFRISNTLLPDSYHFLKLYINTSLIPAYILFFSQF